MFICAIHDLGLALECDLFDLARLGIERRQAGHIDEPVRDRHRKRLRLAEAFQIIRDRLDAQPLDHGALAGVLSGNLARLAAFMVRRTPNCRSMLDRSTRCAREYTPMAEVKIAFDAADDYERFMGRWSRAIGENFLTWLDRPPARDGSISAAAPARSAS